MVSMDYGHNFSGVLQESLGPCEVVHRCSPSAANTVPAAESSGVSHIAHAMCGLSQPVLCGIVGRETNTQKHKHNNDHT